MGVLFYFPFFQRVAGQTGGWCGTGAAGRRAAGPRRQSPPHRLLSTVHGPRDGQRAGR